MRRIWRGPERRRQRPAERREMEEYTQLTIADWLEMKTKLKQELLAASASFVRIGYMLRRIQDEELYKADGFKSIADFAEQECGLSASAVSRFIAINKKYSIDGYSDRLRTEFTFLGQSKLAEMLTLPDSDMELIRPETERSQIRDLKRFNKEEPEPGKVISVNQLIEAFFHDNRQELNEIFRRGGIYTMRDIKALAKNLNKVAWILLFPGFPPQKSPNRTRNARRTLRNHHDADQEQAQNQQSDRQPGQQPSPP